MRVEGRWRRRRFNYRRGIHFSSSESKQDINNLLQTCMDKEGIITRNDKKEEKNH